MAFNSTEQAAPQTASRTAAWAGGGRRGEAGTRKRSCSRPAERQGRRPAEQPGRRGGEGRDHRSAGHQQIPGLGPERAEPWRQETPPIRDRETPVSVSPVTRCRGVSHGTDRCVSVTCHTLQGRVTWHRQVRQCHVSWRLGRVTCHRQVSQCRDRACPTSQTGVSVSRVIETGRVITETVVPMPSTASLYAKIHQTNNKGQPIVANFEKEAPNSV